MVTEYITIGETTLPVGTVAQIEAAERALLETGLERAEIFLSPHSLDSIEENGDPDSVRSGRFVNAGL
jgi:hypothetical protein